jgi:prophage antirepressor-like protein
MNNSVEIIATINFGGHALDVYDSLYKPLFRAVDVANIIDYNAGDVIKMLQVCEDDEKLVVKILRAGQMRDTYFITEMGLYNILSQSSKPIARKWRRVMHHDLIDLRRDCNLDFSQRMQELDLLMDDISIDDEGRMWQSVAVPGGDVEQRIYKG